MALQPFKSYFFTEFPHSPTEDQRLAMEMILAFLYDQDQRKAMILTGYAGTGKTTLIGHLVKSLKVFDQKCVLLAPTGRAAKVFSSFAADKAFTIHKRIYRKEKISDGSIQLVLAPNLGKNTLFIIDEASMIGDYTLQANGRVSERNLLADVINFVFSAPGCSLLLVGDEGQLPPVGSDFSPALNSQYLKNHYPQLKLCDVRLHEVMRQSNHSDILYDASLLRGLDTRLDAMEALRTGKDVFRINGQEFQEILEDVYQAAGSEEVVIITKSNKRANAYNQEIRKRIFYFEDELCQGDLLMAVKNNYFWLEETSEAGFIANGEMMLVKRVRNQETLYGFIFQRVIVALIDYPDMGDFEVLLLLESLTVETPSLPREEMKKLFFAVEEDYLDERNKRKRYEKVLANPYFNALQVKFAYAITCHKAQGGQWERVFLDHGYLNPEQDELQFKRWLYTGFTRAKERLYLVNFDDSFFE